MNVIKNFLEFTKKKSDFWIVGPFSGQSKNYEKKQEDFLEVNDLRGFAMFLNMKEFVLGLTFYPHRIHHKPSHLFRVR